MIYSLTFEKDGVKKNTWEDWHLLAVTRPIFNAPEPRLNKITVPGRNGALSFAKSLTGEVLFEERVGTLSFRYVGKYSFASVYSEILNFLHGQDVKVVSSDMINYYYEGTITVENPDFTGKKEFADLELSYELYPYMKWSTNLNEPTLWDEIDFDSDMLVDGGAFDIPEGNSTFSFYGDARPLPLKVRVVRSSGTVTMTYEGETYTLDTAINVFTGIKVGAGEHTLAFNAQGGAATIEIDYRGERL